MEINYKSKFKFRYILWTLLLLLWALLINLIFKPDIGYVVPMSFVVVAILIILYASLRPRQMADEILLETEDKLNFFNNNEAMAQIVSLGQHYGFERQDDYSEIKKASFLRMLRKTNWLEDYPTAELKIYKTSSGQLKAELALQNKSLFFIGPGLFPQLFKFSQDLKQQLT